MKKLLQDYINNAKPVNTLSGAGAAIELKLARSLIKNFDCTDDDIKWLQDRINLLVPVVQIFEEEISKDLKENADKLNKLNDEWDIITGDGLEKE